MSDSSGISNFDENEDEQKEGIEKEISVVLTIITQVLEEDEMEKICICKNYIDQSEINLNDKKNIFVETELIPALMIKCIEKNATDFNISSGPPQEGIKSSDVNFNLSNAENGQGNFSGDIYAKTFSFGRKKEEEDPKELPFSLSNEEPKENQEPFSSEINNTESKKEDKKEEPVKEEPVKEEPVKEEPVKEEPVKEEPVKEEPVEEEIKMEGENVQKDKRKITFIKLKDLLNQLKKHGFPITGSMINIFIPTVNAFVFYGADPVDSNIYLDSDQLNLDYIQMKIIKAYYLELISNQKNLQKKRKRKMREKVKEQRKEKLDIS